MAGRASESADSSRSRRSSAPQVYRFFASAGECASYLSGSWHGVAIQGIADWPPADRMRLRLDCGEDHRLTLRLKAMPGARGGWWQRLRAHWNRPRSSHGGNSLATAPTLFERDATVSFELGGGRSHEFASDYARLVSADPAGEWELSVQVLEAVRAHCQLSRRSGERGPVIYYSGVVEKTR